MGETSQNNLPPPLVTVVIPCYNYESVVARAIKSVQAQTLSNFECFVVDNNSTDNSAEAIKNAIKGDRRFKYLLCEEQGVAHTRNMGVFAGSAPFVTCLDADDQIAPEFLEICVDALEKNSAIGIAYTGLFYIRPDGKQGLSTWPGQFDYDAFLRGANQIPTCNVSRREIWERLGGQRQRYAPYGAGEEDAELWLRAGAYGWRAQKVTDAGLFIYSWMSGRVSGNKEHKMVDFRAWHPWTKDGKHPFASMAKPERFSHPVRQYDQPSISVIIPVGPGHEKTVVDALDSLEAQTFRQWEAIVVFDTDAGTKSIRESFPFARWFWTGGNKGAGYARNLGAKHARSDFLLFLDADDWLDPKALETMLEAFAAEQSIVYTDYVGKADISPELAKEYKERLLEYDEKTGSAVVRFYSADYDCERAIIQPFPNEKGQPYLWNLITSLVPKVWHDEIGGFDEKMPSWEDWDYFIRLAKAGKCFVRVPEILVIYRFYTGNRRETGIQIHADLLQYLRDKYEGIKTMPCSSCGKKIYNSTNSTPPPQSSAERYAASQQVQRTTQLNDQDFLLVEYMHPNRGAHKVVGPTTGLVYGYRSGMNGERFLAHKADIATMPDVFRVVEIATPKVVSSPIEEIDDAPPPFPIMQSEEEQVEETREFDLQSIPGVTPLIAQQLQAEGVHTLEDLAKIEDEALQKMKGIGPARAAAILKFARDQVKNVQPI